MEAKLKQGIESATQKKIVKMIKDSKLKVQAQIQGDEIRVTGKSRDDLQAVMAMVRGGDLGQPFQFKTSAINFLDIAIDCQGHRGGPLTMCLLS